MFLGSGSAFTVGADNFQANMLLINEQGNKLLIDCGTDIRWSLHASGLSYLDITDIYISHIHADHTGGLEYVGFSTKFDPRCSKPKLYVSKDIVSDLWDRSLSGSMRSIEGEIANLDTYFDVQNISKNSFFIWKGIQINTVQSMHIYNGYSTVPSYGLFLEVKKIKVFLTTDTQFCLEQLGNFYNRSDIIFQDCETSPYKSGVHAHYEELLSLPENVKNKMWLYHYQPGKLPDAKQDGFRGFVKRGQVFDFSDLNTLSPLHDYPTFSA